MCVVFWSSKCSLYVRKITQHPCHVSNVCQTKRLVLFFEYSIISYKWLLGEEYLISMGIKNIGVRWVSIDSKNADLSHLHA